MTAPSKPHRSLTTRQDAFLQLLLVSGLTAAFLSWFSIDDTVGDDWTMKALLVGRMAVLIALCSYLLRRGGERWRDVGLRRPWRWWTLPLLVIGGFIALLLLAGTIQQLVLPALGLVPTEPRPITTVRSDLPQYLFYATLISWGTAAFGEELLLRGFVLDRFRKLIGSSRQALVVAIFVQALLFGSFHWHQGAQALVATAAGIVFGFVWWIGGRNLWACIILHGLVDTVTYFNYYAGPSVAA